MVEREGDVEGKLALALPGFQPCSQTSFPAQIVLPQESVAGLALSQSSGEGRPGEKGGAAEQSRGNFLPPKGGAVSPQTLPGPFCLSWELNFVFSFR